MGEGSGCMKEYSGLDMFEKIYIEIAREDRRLCEDFLN